VVRNQIEFFVSVRDGVLEARRLHSFVVCREMIHKTSA
jgi:hypothetical protein